MRAKFKASITIGVFSIIGIALYFIVKSVVTTQVEKEIKLFRSQLDSITRLQIEQQQLRSEINIENGIWTPAITTLPDNPEVSGTYQTFGQVCVVNAEIPIESSCLSDNHRVILCGLPFCISNPKLVARGAACLINKDNSFRVYHAIVYGHLQLLLYSDVFGPLKTSELEKGTTLVISLTYPILKN